MYAVRLVIGKDWSLRDIEKYVHDMIYLHVINTTERGDRFYSCRGYVYIEEYYSLG